MVSELSKKIKAADNVIILSDSPLSSYSPAILKIPTIQTSFTVLQ
jgi:hypothetical protein